MEKTLEIIISERCNVAIEECMEYLEKEYEGKLDDDELSIMAQKLVYKKAVKDTIMMLRYFKLM